MSPEQRQVHDKVIAGRRGRIRGPLRAALYNAELADRWQAFGELLRYNTTLSPRLSELAILVTARACQSPFEWNAHRVEAEKAGLEASIIEALLLDEAPAALGAVEDTVYRFVRELNAHNSVSDTTYTAALEYLGARTVVELTALVGYYTMVAMTLNTHEIPLDDDMEAAFPLPQHDQLR